MSLGLLFVQLAYCLPQHPSLLSPPSLPLPHRHQHRPRLLRVSQVCFASFSRRVLPRSFLGSSIPLLVMRLFFHLVLQVFASSLSSYLLLSFQSPIPGSAEVRGKIVHRVRFCLEALLQMLPSSPALLFSSLLHPILLPLCGLCCLSPLLILEQSPLRFFLFCSVPPLFFIFFHISHSFTFSRGSLEGCAQRVFLH